MRLRRRPELQEAIKSYGDLVLPAEKIKVALAGQKKLQVEIGTGKGHFLTTLASQNKEDFFVGIEAQTEVLYYAALKAKALELTNLKLIQGNANFLEEWFLPEQVETIYINFCDPWPKARHAKRRLVARNFLAKYQSIVQPSGLLKFKTDNRALFEFALAELSLCNLEILAQTTNLHQSEIENNIWTEYESKFYKLGMPIYYFVAAFARKDRYGKG